MTALNLATTLPAVTVIEVDAERDRRLAGGTIFRGHVIQCDEVSQGRIQGMVIAATLAIQRNDGSAATFRWQNPNKDFAWWDIENIAVSLTAYDMVELGVTAAAFVSAMIGAGRNLKDRPVIPLDYRADHWWSL